jgi:hypothetical protein
MTGVLATIDALRAEVDTLRTQAATMAREHATLTEHCDALEEALSTIAEAVGTTWDDGVAEDTARVLAAIPNVVALRELDADMAHEAGELRISAMKRADLRETLLTRAAQIDAFGARLHAIVGASNE